MFGQTSLACGSAILPLYILSRRPVVTPSRDFACKTSGVLVAPLLNVIAGYRGGEKVGGLEIPQLLVEPVLGLDE